MINEDKEQRVKKVSEMIASVMMIQTQLQLVSFVMMLVSHMMIKVSSQKVR